MPLLFMRLFFERIICAPVGAYGERTKRPIKDMKVKDQTFPSRHSSSRNIEMI
jgi:hypothetical protein